MKGLDQLDRGDSARVVAVDARIERGALVQRLSAIGLLPGVSVRIVGLAPLGDPITVELGPAGTRLSLRRAEARAVRVEPVTAGDEPSSPARRERSP